MASAPFAGKHTELCMTKIGCWSIVSCCILRCPSTRVLDGAVTNGMCLPCACATEHVAQQTICASSYEALCHDERTRRVERNYSETPGAQTQSLCRTVQPNSVKVAMIAGEDVQTCFASVLHSSNQQRTLLIESVWGAMLTKPAFQALSSKHCTD